MMSLVRPRAWVWSLIFAVAVALPFFTTAKSRRDIYFFEVTLTSDSVGVVQVFYDTGRNLSDQESVTKGIGTSSTPTVFRFGLPPATFRSFRLDPLNHAGVMTITKVQIVDRDGNVIRRFPLSELKPNNQIASSAITNDVMAMHTIPEATDPYYEINPAQPIPLVVGFKNWLSASLKPFFIGWLAMFALTAVPWQRLRGTRLGRLTPWLEANPRKAVACLSLLVVTVQCHPVIFFGKSFVSPDNAVLLLYDEFPVLPGYHSTELENAQASDVGALMWWHLYCPVIAHDALFRDHQLPLWNRYSLSGVPLLGQGQTMFGDPLNWLTIFTRSAAWSWDLRFLISRWLMCCGLGLTVFALTRHLPASLLSTVAAGFLGFFAFRLNHPANFSLEYSPWILLAWVTIVQSVTWPATLRWCLLLMLANFSVLNSGTMKEAYMLVACLNFAGLLMLGFTQEPRRQRLRTASIALAGGAIVGLLEAPTLLTFVRTLKLSWTSYDLPRASQATMPMLVGFFDDLFTRQMRPGEITFLPACNFLMLLGVLWALSSLRALATNRTFVALALASLLPLSMAYGLMPAGWITSLPFIANIIHIDNTMSCPMIVFASILSGYGFAAFFEQLGRPAWKRTYVGFLLLLGLLLANYLSTMQQTAKSPFFVGYAWSLVLAIVAMPLFLHVARQRRDAQLLIATLLGGILLMTWRHAQYLHSPFDDYVVNPEVRANLHPRSPVVDFLDRKMTEPSRPVGFGLNLFPAYNTMLGWESILGVDPLRSRYLDDLGVAFGIPRIREPATPIVGEARTLVPLPGLDLLNVRYYLTTHSDAVREIPGLRPVGKFDLDVYESPTAWPRAFFTDRVTFYQDASEFAEKARDGDHRPFAAFQLNQRDIPAGVEYMVRDLASRRVEAASDYHLTTNNTAFEVKATGPGVVVLAESYYPGEFRALVNGKVQPYFRVNHSAKGIYLESAGIYRIEFDYWPRYMTLSLVLAAVGFTGLLAFIWFAIRPPLRR